MGKSLTNNRADLFAYIAGTSGLKLSTDWIHAGRVDRGYIVIHECAPRMLREIVTRFDFVSLTPDGLVIPTTPPEDSGGVVLVG